MNRIKFLFAWYDMWMGIFWDRKKRKLYIFFLPMLGIVIDCAPKLRYFAIYSPPIQEVVGVCTDDGAGDCLRECPNCELRPISKREFDDFE